MNFWHLQIHPNNSKKFPSALIKNILEQKKVIGLGDHWLDKNNKSAPDPKHFKESIQINDIVMIRDGHSPLALVQVTSDAFIEKKTDENFDWFPLRREIIVLSYFGKETESLLETTLDKYSSKHIQASGTLTHCSNSNAQLMILLKIGFPK